MVDRRKYIATITTNAARNNSTLYGGFVINFVEIQKRLLYRKSVHKPNSIGLY